MSSTTRPPRPMRSSEADIAKLPDCGHANIATTRLYERRKSRPQDSPTFKIRS
jgi:hypothetical protein